MDLLDLLDRPISFHRCFVDLSGSINGALMLSQAVYWTRRTSNEDGSFYKSRDEWREETGLTHEQQESARKALRKTAFWKERHDRMAHKVFYRIDKAELRKALSAIPVSGNRETRRAKPENTVSSNRAETTTESTDVVVEKEKKPRKGSGKATIEEVVAFTVSLGRPPSDGEYMFHNFEEKGWGKNWQAAIRKWNVAQWLPSQKAQKTIIKKERVPETDENGNYIGWRNYY